MKTRKPLYCNFTLRDVCYYIILEMLNGSSAEFDMIAPTAINSLRT